MKSFSKKYQRLGISLLILNFIFVSSAFGQSISTEVVSDYDSEIFPFADMAPEETDSSEDSNERTLDYTEEFYEITNEGIYDPDGNVIEVIEDENNEDEFFLDETFLLDAEEGLDDDKPKIPLSEEGVFEAYRESIISNWGGKKAFTEHRLKGVRENLEQEMNYFETLNKEIEELEEKLVPIHQEIETLKDQINLLNHQLVESKNKIKSAEYQVAEKEIFLKDLMWDVKRSEVELSIQRKIVLEYIVLVYQEEEKFLDYYNESSSTLKFLLADNSVSENLLGQEYLKVLEKAGREVFYDLHEKKQVLEEKQDKIWEERQELEELYQSLNQEKRILEEGRHTKKDLLEKTRGEEEKYQQLLEESIQQQLESAIAVQNLKDNIEFIEQKLELLDESLEKVEEFASDPEKTEALEDLEAEIIDEDKEVEEGFISEIEEQIEPFDFSQDDKAEEEVMPKIQPFIWPVPANKITAYFEDPSYPKKWGIHKAVDIRAKQYTEIKAPANAYVFQTKDNGMGYSYIILAHKNQFITVYGHVSEIKAKPGTVIKQGDVIGLSGGTPGTKGAGWQTTGSHLHFEVWHKGEQIDPLDWLPILELPIEYIPDRFFEELNS